MSMDSAKLRIEELTKYMKDMWFSRLPAVNKGIAYGDNYNPFIKERYNNDNNMINTHLNDIFIKDKFEIDEVYILPNANFKITDKERYTSVLQLKSIDYDNHTLDFTVLLAPNDTTFKMGDTRRISFYSSNFTKLTKYQTDENQELDTKSGQKEP